MTHSSRSRHDGYSKEFAMIKKVFAVLAVLASLAWIVDIAITVSQGNAGPPVAVKFVLIVCFLYYAYRVFFAAKPSAEHAASDQ